MPSACAQRTPPHPTFILLPSTLTRCPPGLQLPNLSYIYIENCFYTKRALTLGSPPKNVPAMANPAEKLWIMRRLVLSSQRSPWKCLHDVTIACPHTVPLLARPLHAHLRVCTGPTVIATVPSLVLFSQRSLAAPLSSLIPCTLSCVY